MTAPHIREQFEAALGGLPGGAEAAALRRAALDRFDALGLPSRGAAGSTTCASPRLSRPPSPEPRPYAISALFLPRASPVRPVRPRSRPAFPPRAVAATPQMVGNAHRWGAPAAAGTELNFFLDSDGQGDDPLLAVVVPRRAM